MPSILIEDNVALPAATRTEGARKYPFAKMLVGQSFALAIADESRARVENRLRTAVARYAKQEKGTVRFAVRALETEVRVWRVA